MTKSTITIKIEKEIKEKMKEIKINWSEYIREVIRRRIELEERKKVAEKLLKDLKAGKYTVPKGFINKSIRELRDTR
jgi:predicted DNA-binding protein